MTFEEANQWVAEKGARTEIGLFGLCHHPHSHVRVFLPPDTPDAYPLQSFGYDLVQAVSRFVRPAQP